MVDLEGPSTRAGLDGNIYVMTFICVVCHGTLLEKSKRASGSDVRRMFASCVLRSGTIPLMIHTDRGPEFKNHLMAEYAALVGIGRRFGTPWRPMEQGLVEVTHQETQRLMGILVKDVLKCFPTSPENFCE